MKALSPLTKPPFYPVITDYQMPFMDGYRLADRIKAKYVEPRLNTMTGHCEEEVAGMLAGYGVLTALC